MEKSKEELPILARRHGFDEYPRFHQLLRCPNERQKKNRVVAEEIAITELPEDAVASQAEDVGIQNDEKKKGKKKNKKK